MKIENIDEPIRVLNASTDVKSVIEEITENGNQEDAFYVCNLDDIVNKHDIWQDHLPRVEPHYAVKCNDDITVLEVLAALGTSFDCASKAEINKILSIGVNTDRIIFANPVKPSSHLRYAASVGVTTMTFDNESELYKIQTLYPTANLVIRIRCDATDAQCPLGMKFGCDPIKEAPILLQTAKSLDLNVIGVSFHVGSGCREPDVFHRAIASARDIFDYAEDLGFRFSLLDIGGGYPGAHKSSINEIASIINKALDQFFPDPSIRIIAEPGRFYVCSAYTLSCNIYSIRNISENENAQTPTLHKMYYINDGVYGSFNCVLYDHQVVYPEPLRDPGTKLYSSSIWGPTCDGLDHVKENVMLPEMKVGDWIIFKDMGAYTLSASTSFNGFPISKVHYAASENVWTLLKDQITFTEDRFKIPTNLKKSNDNLFNFVDIPGTIELPHYKDVSVAGDHLLRYIDITLDE